MTSDPGGQTDTPAGTAQYSFANFIPAIGRLEFDPVGADLSLTQPEAPPPTEGRGDIGVGHFAGIMYSRFSDFFNISGGCTIDGMSSSCALAMTAVNAGAAKPLPRGVCLSKFVNNLTEAPAKISATTT